MVAKETLIHLVRAWPDVWDWSLTPNSCVHANSWKKIRMFSLVLFIISFYFDHVMNHMYIPLQCSL